MTQLASPRISHGPRFPLVWVVPLLALAIGGWMMLREFHQRGTVITIHFLNGSGVEAAKTALVYKGVNVGTVQEVGLENDLHGAVIKLRLHRDAEPFARTGSQFWIVRPEVTFSGVRGLETLIAGVQLNGRPGTGPPAKEFTGLERQPAPDDRQRGRAFLLRASKLSSLTTGAPVYYREVKVGAVETSWLASDATEVVIRIRVDQPYMDLVRTNSQFWNAGGATFKANLLGVELKSTSLEALLTGGVGFATPDQDGRLAPVAEEGGQFTLHDEPEKEWLKWQPHIPIKPVENEPTQPPRATEVPAALKG